MNLDSYQQKTSFPTAPPMYCPTFDFCEFDWNVHLLVSESEFDHFFICLRASVFGRNCLFVSSSHFSIGKKSTSKVPEFAISKGTKIKLNYIKLKFFEI